MYLLSLQETMQLHQSLRQYSGVVRELHKIETRLQGTGLDSQVQLQLEKTRLNYRHRAQRLLYHMKVRLVGMLVRACQDWSACALPNVSASTGAGGKSPTVQAGSCQRRQTRAHRDPLVGQHLGAGP